jgi:hypothetical protein
MLFAGAQPKPGELSRLANSDCGSALVFSCDQLSRIHASRVGTPKVGLFHRRTPRKRHADRLVDRAKQLDRQITSGRGRQSERGREEEERYPAAALVAGRAPLLSHARLSLRPFHTSSGPMRSKRASTSSSIWRQHMTSWKTTCKRFAATSRTCMTLASRLRISWSSFASAWRFFGPRWRASSYRSCPREKRAVDSA